MNSGFRRFLVLLSVFLFAFLAVFVIRKIQSGVSLADLLMGRDANHQHEPEDYTLRLQPSVDLSSVEVLAAVNAESSSLVRAVVPSVVSIDTTDIRQVPQRDFWGRTWVQPRAVQGQGSGVIVTEEGHVLTNHHVIQGNPHIRLTLHDGTEYFAKVIGTDPAVDIAVLKIDDKGPFQALKFGDSSKVEVGNLVFAIGNPFGLGTSVTDGKISAKKRPFADSHVDLLQTSAPINPGNSGGPLVNIRGEIIGINSRIWSTDKQNPGFQGIGFAIPSNAALKTLQDILAKGHPVRGFVGIGLKELDPATRRKFGYNERGGVHVIKLVPNSPATQAGLLEDDIIISFDSTPVQNTGSLIGLVQQSQVGSQVAIEIWREGARHTLTATVGDADNFSMGIAKSTKETQNSRPGVESILRTIGIYVRNLTELERSSGANGVVVYKLSPDSILRGKLLVNDRILSINGSRVDDSADFLTRLVALAPVKATELLVRRGQLTFLVNIPRMASP